MSDDTTQTKSNEQWLSQLEDSIGKKAEKEDLEKLLDAFASENVREAVENPDYLKTCFDAFDCDLNFDNLAVLVRYSPKDREHITAPENLANIKKVRDLGYKTNPVFARVLGRDIFVDFLEEIADLDYQLPDDDKQFFQAFTIAEQPDSIEIIRLLKKVGLSTFSPNAAEFNVAKEMKDVLKDDDFVEFVKYMKTISSFDSDFVNLPSELIVIREYYNDKDLRKELQSQGFKDFLESCSSLGEHMHIMEMDSLAENYKIPRFLDAIKQIKSFGINLADLAIEYFEEKYDKAHDWIGKIAEQEGTFRIFDALKSAGIDKINFCAPDLFLDFAKDKNKQEKYLQENVLAVVKKLIDEDEIESFDAADLKDYNVLADRPEIMDTIFFIEKKICEERLFEFVNLDTFVKLHDNPELQELYVAYHALNPNNKLSESVKALEKVKNKKRTCDVLKNLSSLDVKDVVLAENDARELDLLANMTVLPDLLEVLDSHDYHFRLKDASHLMKLDKPGMPDFIDKLYKRLNKNLELDSIKQKMTYCPRSFSVMDAEPILKLYRHPRAVDLAEELGYDPFKCYSDVERLCLLSQIDNTRTLARYLKKKRKIRIHPDELEKVNHVFSRLKDIDIIEKYLDAIYAYRQFDKLDEIDIPEENLTEYIDDKIEALTYDIHSALQLNVCDDKWPLYKLARLAKNLDKEALLSGIKELGYEKDIPSDDLLKTMIAYTLTPFEQRGGPRRNLIMKDLADFNPEVDQFGNILIKKGEGNPKVVVTSHMDTVFKLDYHDQELRINKDNIKGTLDNALGCTINSQLVKDVDPVETTWFYFTVDEEPRDGKPDGHTAVGSGAEDIVDYLKYHKISPDLCVVLDITVPDKGHKDFENNKKIGCCIENFNDPDFKRYIRDFIKEKNLDMFARTRKYTIEDETEAFLNDFTTMAVGPVLFDNFHSPESYTYFKNIFASYAFMKDLLEAKHDFKFKKPEKFHDTEFIEHKIETAEIENNGVILNLNGNKKYKRSYLDLLIANTERILTNRLETLTAIRKVTPYSIGFAYGILQKAFTEESLWDFEYFWDAMHDSMNINFIVEADTQKEGKRLVGFSIAVPYGDDFDNEQEADYETVDFDYTALLPDWQRKGIGTKLNTLRFVESALQGYRTVRMESWAENPKGNKGNSRQMFLNNFKGIKDHGSFTNEYDVNINLLEKEINSLREVLALPLEKGIITGKELENHLGIKDLDKYLQEAEPVEAEHTRFTAEVEYDEYKKDKDINFKDYGLMQMLASSINANLEAGPDLDLYDWLESPYFKLETIDGSMTVARNAEDFMNDKSRSEYNLYSIIEEKGNTVELRDVAEIGVYLLGGRRIADNATAKKLEMEEIVNKIDAYIGTKALASWIKSGM